MAREAIIGKVISKVTFKINDLTGTKKARKILRHMRVYIHIYAYEHTRIHIHV